MDAFLEQLAKTVEQNILAALAGQLNAFAKNVVELPEMKEKGVTAEQVLDCWNSVSEFKVVLGAAPASSAPAAAAAASGAETPSRKPRAQTDKNHKCQVPKQRGDHKGEPCGKNCVVGTDYCPEHLKKNQPSGSTAAPATPATAESTPAPAAAAPAPAAPKPAAVAGATCEHVLQTGANKGQACGKKATSGTWCTTHAKKH
jgi:cell division protein FtsN